MKSGRFVHGALGFHDLQHASSEDQAEHLVQWLLHHALDLSKHAERVEALRPATIETENSAQLSGII